MLKIEIHPVDPKRDSKKLKKSESEKKSKIKDNEVISIYIPSSPRKSHSKMKIEGTKGRSTSNVDPLDIQKLKKTKKASLPDDSSPTHDKITKITRLSKRSSSSSGMNISALKLPFIQELERGLIHVSPRSKQIKVVSNPVLSSRFRRLDRSSSMRLSAKENVPKAISREDDDWKMMRIKKNSLNSIEFSMLKENSHFESILKRTISEPFLNSWEYGNIDADFATPEHGSVSEYLQVKFDNKAKYRRSRKKKRNNSPDNEVMLTILKDVNDKITEISHDGNDVVYEKISEKEIKIMAGTKEKLFTILADHRVQDKEYIDIFLATHLRFMSTKELLNSLLNYFDNPLTHETMKKLNDQETNQYKMLLRMRIVNVFKKWLKYHYAYEFDSIDIATKIETWIISLKKDKDLSKMSEFLKETWNNRLKTNIESYEFDEEAPPKSILPKKSSASDLNFLDLDPIELARQITLLNQRMFKYVRNNHLLQVLDNKDDIYNPVVGISKYSKTLTAWVTTEIITTPQVKKRVVVLSNFIRLCHCLVRMNNFHAALDIYLGISHYLVTKLKKTRKGLNSSTKDKFKALDELFKPDGGWKNLRKSIKESTSPLIIPPAIWLHDLIAINENDDYWETKNEHKLLNFHKLRLFCSVFQEVYKCQLEPYNFELVPMIETYLTNHLLAMSMEDLENESKIIEVSNESRNKDSLKQSKKDKLVRKPSLLTMFRSPKKEK